MWLMLLGIVVLLWFYAYVCWKRWMIARHYGDPFLLMGPRLIAEAWDHLEFSNHPRLFRWLSLIIMVLGACLTVLGCLLV